MYYGIVSMHVMNEQKTLSFEDADINAEENLDWRLGVMENSQMSAKDMIRRIYELEQENKKLTETVEWMHDTIWSMLRERKKIEMEQAHKEAAAAVYFPSESMGTSFLSSSQHCL